jgi:dUTP pyrophosphatase
METIQIKKCYKDSKIPYKNNASDAGYDLHAYMAGDQYMISIRPGERVTLATGIAISLPEMKDYDMYARVAPRSGLAANSGLDVLAGVVDRGYTGEIKIVLLNTGTKTIVIKKEERVAQLIPTLMPITTLKTVKTFKDTARGDKGLGSSGKDAAN